MPGRSRRRFSCGTFYIFVEREVTFRFGAIHEPLHPSTAHALPFTRAGTSAPPNWFEAWNWRPDDGNDLGNSELSDCVPAADLRLVQAFKARAGVQWRIPRKLVELRYEATGGWQRTPETDNGTITQADCFDWSLSPIIAGEAYPVTWTIVDPGDVLAALRHGPLLVTLGLEQAVEDDPETWDLPATGAPTSLHRVVVGAATGGLLLAVTYGMIVSVHPSRIVAVDLIETD